MRSDSRSRVAKKINGTLSSASHYFFSRRANKEKTGGLSLLLRHVRPNRSDANAAEKIRDVGDNVPPRNGSWLVVRTRGSHFVFGLTIYFCAVRYSTRSTNSCLLMVCSRPTGMPEFFEISRILTLDLGIV